MMPGGKFGLTNGVGIPPVFCVSADKSLNFRLKHFTPIPKANDSEKTVMNSSSSVLPHYAKRDYDYHYFSSKQQNAKLFTLSCEMKDRLLLQQHHFILCYAGWCSTAPHSHLMVHRVVMKLWFVIFLQLHCCKTCRILTAQTQCCFRTWIRCLEPLNWKRYKKLARLALKVGFQASRQAFQDNEKVSPFAV